MTIRNGDNTIDWRVMSKVFFLPLIGTLLSIIGVMIAMQLSELKAGIVELKVGQNEIQTVQAGVLRLNDKQDANIQANTKLIQDKINSLQMTVDEFNALKVDYYRRFGYISTTRSGKEILLESPMK